MNNINKISSIISRIDKPFVLILLRKFGATIGNGCDIETNLLIHNSKNNYSNLVIGDKCHIGKEVFLDLSAPINIGDRVTVSMRTTIITHLDVGKSKLSDIYQRNIAPVIICSDAYIGASSTILKGVTIGEKAVVAAGAMVCKDVPPYTVVGGVPARLIKKIDH